MKIGIGWAAALIMAATTQAQPVQRAEAAVPEAISLTVYPSDLALVREQRPTLLPDVLARLRIGAIPTALHPETAMLQADGQAGLQLLELRHETDRLSPQTLLARWASAGEAVPDAR